MSEIFDRKDGGFVFIDEGAVLSPVQTDRFLKLLNNELNFAHRDVRNAREEELRCFQEYLTARKPHEVDPDCPEVGTGVGKVTEKARELWFEARIPKPYWAWKQAVLARQNAQDYARQVDKQVRIMQSLNNNAKLGYETYPRGGGR